VRQERDGVDLGIALMLALSGLATVVFYLVVTLVLGALFSSSGGSGFATVCPRADRSSARRGSRGSGNRRARIHTSCAVISAPTLDLAFARWCFTVEGDKPSRGRLPSRSRSR
jgi:hypothetical protein